MCYMNCPYEDFHGDCTQGKNIPADAYCREDEEPTYNDYEEPTELDF